MMTPSDRLRQAKEQAVERNWLPFEAIDIAAGYPMAKERRFLSKAISETRSGFWPNENLAGLFDRAIALADAEAEEEE